MTVYMKRYNYFLLLLLGICYASCTSQVEEFHYDGGSFVLFADSQYVMPLTEADAVFEIPVGFTSTADHERTVAVQVDVKQSNAIEGYHFVLENPNVTIPAGRSTAMLRMKGRYAHVPSVDDSLSVTLRILADPALTSDLYGHTTHVRLQKVRPFHIEDYVGDLQLTCTFPYSTSSVTSFNVKSEKVNDSTLVIRSLFDKTRDMVLRFHTGKDNPFDQNIDVREQVAFTDATFGQVSMASVPGAPSYYLPEDRAFILYLNAYLAQMGTFGSYYYIFQWISPDQVLADDNGLRTLF